MKRKNLNQTSMHRAFTVRIKLIFTFIGCSCFLFLSKFSYGQNANTEPPNYAAIAAGSIFFWDDYCSINGFAKGSDVLRSTFLVSTNSRIHEGFWEGYFKAKILQQNAKSSFFEYEKKEWIRMSDAINGQDCKKIRDGVNKILAPLIVDHIKKNNEQTK